ncbi:NF1 [Bugula neritina]|uniref:NF1 n=1 Tax=Bugula neritina TaxID=10212 RepID=A0A7J7JGL3_BUGNE|nr:NF1 [Bugula neritina]
MGAENLANCLEDMVENYLPGDDREFDLNNPYPSSLGISASLSLSNLGSPTGSASAAEAAAYRSRHGSQQSRRSSFHKKTRKHSGSFEGIM